MTTDAPFSSYVITDPCIGVKDGTCVEVCPVDCFASSDDEAQFFIDPALCIACEQCVLVCPVDAIYLEHEVPEEWKASIERNRVFFLEAKQDTPAVSVEWAEQLIRSALVRAGELGLDVSVVVVDQRGRAGGRVSGELGRACQGADRRQPRVHRSGLHSLDLPGQRALPSNAPPSRWTARGSPPVPAPSPSADRTSSARSASRAAPPSRTSSAAAPR